MFGSILLLIFFILFVVHAIKRNGRILFAIFPLFIILCLFFSDFMEITFIILDTYLLVNLFNKKRKRKYSSDGDSWDFGGWDFSSDGSSDSGGGDGGGGGD